MQPSTNLLLCKSINQNIIALLFNLLHYTFRTYETTYTFHCSINHFTKCSYLAHMPISHLNWAIHFLGQIRHRMVQLQTDIAPSWNNDFLGDFSQLTSKFLVIWLYVCFCGDLDRTDRWWHIRQTAMYLSAPPITSNCTREYLCFHIV